MIMLQTIGRSAHLGLPLPSTDLELYSTRHGVKVAGKESASASAESSLKETESNLPQDGSSALNSYFENILPPPVYERATKSRKKQKTGELTTTSYLEELRQHGAESERQGGSHNKCII